MRTILLTGIPRVGKSSAIEQAVALSKKFYETSVHKISLGEIVADAAYKQWYTPSERVPFVDYQLQQILRQYGIAETKARCLSLPQNDKVIIDTPMTMFTHAGIIPDIIFTQDDISSLHHARSIDAIVTIIDNPEKVVERLQGTMYPASKEEILAWMVMEVKATETITPSKTRPRHIIIPRHNAEDTIVKLLHDEQPPICYLAGPITDLKEKEADSNDVKKQKCVDREKKNVFLKRLEEYAIVHSPIELADQGISYEEVVHTVHRDIHWFVRNADMTIAYFPGAYTSTGTMEEIRATLREGKPVILIHPDSKQLKKVFDAQPTYSFTDEEEFFAAIPKEPLLQRFLQNSIPRYAHLQPYAVAGDIMKGDKHLLGKRPKGKPYAGQWMLIGGKKEGEETDFQALRREINEEVGLAINNISPDYRLFPVDYAVGSIKYVRIYKINAFEGKLHPNHNAKNVQVDGVKFFTTEEILNRRDIVPATRAYFEKWPQ